MTLVAAIILAAYALQESDFIAAYGQYAGAFAVKLIMFALILRGVGVFSSIIGIMAVRVPAGKMLDPMRPINIGYMTSAIASVFGFFVVNYLYLDDPRTGATDWRFACCASLGIILAVVTLWLTNYFTHPDKGPVTETAMAARTGPATLILSGMAEGLESSVWALLVIAAAIIGAMAIFHESLALQFYGIALTGLGLLTTTGFILAMDTYGPITDNAHGIFEMGGIHQEEASKTLSWMDAIGNTTKALTKGLAIATAVLAAVSLFRSFIDEAHLGAIGVQINMPTVFVGLMIGGAVPFLFSSFAIKAVSRAAYQIVFEVRRQLRDASGDHGGQGAARLRRLRRYRHRRFAERAAGPRNPRGLLAPAGRFRSRRGRTRRIPRRHDPDRPVDGGLHVECGRELGQRQEKNRGRIPGRQGHRRAQGFRRWRHRRRSIQGHRGPRAEPDDQGDEPGRDSGGAVHDGCARRRDCAARRGRRGGDRRAFDRRDLLQARFDRGGEPGYRDQASRLSEFHSSHFEGPDASSSGLFSFCFVSEFSVSSRFILMAIEYRALGKTGLRVSTLGFGGSEIGYQAVAQKAVDKILNTALDAGINVIDTAECYADSEALIGKAIARRRAEVILMTKCGHAPLGSACERAWVTRSRIGNPRCSRGASSAVSRTCAPITSM